MKLVRKPGIALIVEPEMGFWSELQRLKHPGDFFQKQGSAQKAVLENKWLDETIKDVRKRLNPETSPGSGQTLLGL